MFEFYYALPSHNRANPYQAFAIEPATGAIGAEVREVDLRQLGSAGFAELRQALLAHKVLFIRDQSLTLEELEAITLHFGEFGREPYVQGLPGHEHVVRVVKEADEKTPVVFGGAWHTDWSFQERPPAFTLLYGVDIPPFGGDTLYANLALAHDWLSPRLCAQLDGLDAIHSPERAYGADARHNDLMEHMAVRYGATEGETRSHPLVTRHAETGQRILYVNPAYTSGIKGLRPAEAQPLLDYLYSVATQPAFTCRMRWRRGTLAIWDNRSTWHLPVADYHGMRRELWRTTVRGEVPSR
ncbi:MAG: (R)-phenoxypropionate/alpha-ketoglutarate-dioxygenase [Pseudomonas citronellolis]|nr:MAG: (R)-phenoxypropionate/alpha-ketoglutarate-dioxygenase [Pseudomonas citronellolis]